MLSQYVLRTGIAALALAAVAAAVVPGMLHPDIVTPTGFSKIKSSGNSSLFVVNLPKAPFAGAEGKGDYTEAPLVVHLKGTRRQIGYDYAALLASETSYTLKFFLDSVFPKADDQLMLMTFIDYCWDSWLAKNTPQEFLDELAGMKAWHGANPSFAGVPPNVVAQRFYTLANMPADPDNIISMLEQEFEQGWPVWLKTIINDIVKLLEHLVHSCDSYGVWGSRTEGGLLYSSRNLDYNSNTGINKYKLVTVYSIDDPKYGGKPAGGTYASMGFSFGLGALAGMSQVGITTSEMNLDNSKVTFSGLAFPLRLRYVLERSVDLQSAMSVWNMTHNTNSFNFLIGSAPDALRGNNGAYALETIMDFTGEFPANSPIERDATYLCENNACHGWTSQTGTVHIGKPIPEAVFRSNHGFNPRVMATQEPLFNNTVFRYDLMHDLFVGLEAAQKKIDDTTAVDIVATLGTKGHNYLTCNQPLIGDNVMSIAYVPGPRIKNGSPAGHFYVAWESGSGDNWRPAACSPYIKISMQDWV